MKTTTKRNRTTKSEAKPALPVNGNGIKPKRKRDRAGKKQALIQAALGLFASKGYETTTTREIAATAGCAEGLIHRYFKGKTGLLAAIIEHRAAKDTLDLTPPMRPAHNLEDEFLHLVDREVERMWESRDFLRVFIPRAIVDPSASDVIDRAFLSARAQAISQRLKRYESGSLPHGEMEILTQAVSMLGLVFGFVRPVLLGHDRPGAKKMAAVIAKVLMGNPAVSSAI